MKALKVILCGLFLVSWSLSAWAQLSIGFKYSYARSWEDYGDTQLPEGAQTDIASFQISALVQYKINSFLDVGIRPGFARRGAACVPGFVFFEDDTKWQLDYIEAPVLLTGHIDFWKSRMQAFARTGFGGSFLASAIEISEDNPDDRSRLEVGTDSRVRQLDYGFYNALGLGVNTKAGTIFFEMNHYFGLPDTDRFQDSQNRSLAWGIGWMFRL